MGGLTCYLYLFFVDLQVQRVRKSKPPKYTGVLASVMKFHKDDDEESSAKPDA